MWNRIRDPETFEPGSGIQDGKIRIRDKHPRSATLVKRECLNISNVIFLYLFLYARTHLGFDGMITYITNKFCTVPLVFTQCGRSGSESVIFCTDTDPDTSIIKQKYIRKNVIFTVL
jgi:hypothetical protein